MPLPSIEPSKEPEATDAPVTVTSSRNGGHVTVKLDIPGKSDDDVQLFAAMRNNGSIQGIIAPEVKNMTAEFETPAEASDIRLYIWDKNMRPYTAAVKVPPENESGSDTIE